VTFGVHPLVLGHLGPPSVVVSPYTIRIPVFGQV
jgi:hypothetical protein